MADIGSAIGNFLGGIVSSTGLGIGRSGMHAPTPEQAGADILREASAAGLSPLALTGGQMYGGFGAQTGDPGIGGQMLGRAISQATSKPDKLQQLQEQNLWLRNAQLQNDVVAGQMANSVRALSWGQPANAKTSQKDAGTKDIPYSMYEWAYDPDHPERPPVKVISDKYAHTQFGPTAYYTGLAAMPGMIEDWANQANQVFQQAGRDLRGDILRNMQNAPAVVDPTMGQYGGG